MYGQFPHLIPLLLLIISTLVSERMDLVVEAKTVENRIVGKPFVSCRPEGISLVAQTLQFFDGQIYVKGARKNPSCVNQYNLEQNSTKVELKIDAEQLMNCGFKAWPKPNSSKMLLSGQLIVSFHRELVTSSDRSFRAHCEFDDFQRDAYFGVGSSIQNHELILGNFVLPEVSMSIFPSGEEVLEKSSDFQENEIKVLKVGDPIIFQWKLHSAGIFGIQLEKCSAETEDGKGMKIMENGCSLDDELISDATFSPDFSKIFANSLAFKFPEEHVVYIKCAVRTCVRRSEHLQIINGNSADLCSMENDCGGSQRNRRQLANNSTLIHVNGRYRIERNRMFEHLKSAAPEARNVELCMPDVLYYVGISSVFICYLITITTFLYSY